MPPIRQSYAKPTRLSSPSPSSSSDAPSPPFTTAPAPLSRRGRSELSSEEIREARAQRNRLAAQASRDKRKAQFAHLESRVAELEEENRELRATYAARTNSQREKEKERENEELRDRVRVLEKGWENVMKLLAAQNTDNASRSPVQLATTTTTVVAPPTIAATPDTVASSESTPAAEPTRHLAAGGFQATVDMGFDFGTTAATDSATELSTTDEAWLNTILSSEVDIASPTPDPLTTSFGWDVEATALGSLLAPSDDDVRCNGYEPNVLGEWDLSSVGVF